MNEFSQDFGHIILIRVNDFVTVIPYILKSYKSDKKSILLEEYLYLNSLYKKWV